MSLVCIHKNVEIKTSFFDHVTLMMARELGFVMLDSISTNWHMTSHHLKGTIGNKILSTKMIDFIMIHIIVMEKYLAPLSNFRYCHQTSHYYNSIMHEED